MRRSGFDNADAACIGREIMSFLDAVSGEPDVQLIGL